MKTDRISANEKRANLTLKVAIIGPGVDATPEQRDAAEQVGAGIARAGLVVTTGGLQGVMESACRGAKLAGGLTIGYLPGDTTSAANPWVDVALPTGMGELRNGLLVLSADAVVAVGGSWGTSSEIAFAMRRGIPCVVIDGWRVSTEADSEPSPSPARAASSTDAVGWVLEQIGNFDPRTGYPAYPIAASAPVAAKEDLWAAYTSTQQHYESELNLFAGRNNIFLLVAGGLLGFESALWQANTGASLLPVALAGVGLSFMWLVVAVSSYWWLAYWRSHLERLGYEWFKVSRAAPFITQMDLLRTPGDRRLRWLSR